MSIPSATELCLLKVLWKTSPLAARELHERVQHELDWSFSSTRKTLERMVEKGMVAQEALHGVQVYRPLLEKLSTLAAFANDFGRRVMEIDTPLPANMFAGSKLIDSQELARMDALLKSWPDDGEKPE